MRILIFGAGAIGSLYARLLAEAGNDVSVYARGRRLDELAGGLRYRTPAGEVVTAPLRISEHPADDGPFGFTLVPVRYQQAEATLAEVAQIQTSAVMTMINNPHGYRRWADLLGSDRLIPAFPGAGGTIVDGVMDGALLPGRIQTTTVGEVDGTRGVRMQGVVSLFARAKIPVSVCDRMRDLQLSHLALVCPLTDAVRLADGDHLALARNREALSLATQWVRRNLSVLAGKGVQILPWRVSLMARLPEPVTAAWLGRMVRSDFGSRVLARHAGPGRDEFVALRDDFYAELGL